MEIDPMLTKSEIYRLVNDYIGVSDGYLGDFSYRSHAEFYPHYCNLDINPLEIEGTTRERFILILEQASPAEQAKILEGTFRKYPVSDFPEDQREQKQAIYTEFQRIIKRLEASSGSPSDASIAAAIGNLNAEYVRELWERALARRVEDPEGAVTAARSLLESTCKHILDDLNVQHNDRLDLPALYRLVAGNLNLAPKQHDEEIFKRILGGCQSVVGGLAGLRNSLSDAHGKGRRSVRPASRHAELAVNLAGTMATFLIQTLETRKSVGNLNSEGED